MWKKVLVVIAVIMLLTGIGFFFFFPVSNFVGQQNANSLIEQYDKVLDNVITEEDTALKEKLGVTADSFEEAREKGEVDEEGYPIDIVTGERTYSYPITFQNDLDRLYEDSKAYNASILYHQGTVDTADFRKAALNLSSYGLSNVYGYLSAPAIDMDLPVYLGASDYMMNFGAAQLYGTSLPIDEKNTNVCIAGHTGYIGRIFFDNIRHLRKGDTVSFSNYWETIDYKVIDYKVITPTQTEDFIIQPNRQLITLITCTPAGHGQFNRYIVIAEKE